MRRLAEIVISNDHVHIFVKVADSAKTASGLKCEPTVEGLLILHATVSGLGCAGNVFPISSAKLRRSRV